jgi:hypothetical protein
VTAPVCPAGERRAGGDHDQAERRCPDPPQQPGSPSSTGRRGEPCNSRARGKKRGVPLCEFELRDDDTIVSTGTFWSERIFKPGDTVDWLPVPGTVREFIASVQPGTSRLILDVPEGAS